ncbi:RNA polymerase sporulation sigma factor SigK [Heliorestis acidaminivorans]|uniref:RNA polymerase sigma factor n=1 Tax=Heliorestis acidaminivorans TaxID=553427 RepID=A0A6I0EXP1_9FIRM|nr:RNA polymerase sporulation sigma factor SigK [Heliorestis acidaminivorans]KAB2951290.1 RNA polymerase sporulation sigma factor SigK [Heliorestis acidaminivorans]
MIDIVGALILPFIKGVTALMSYISNNAFPHPLSEKEEKLYLQKLTKGDGEARNKLIEHNLRLVAHVCKKFDGTGENNDDLISIGTIGLIKAINTFKPDKGTKLATYAARCIENEILMHLRAMKKTRGEVSLHDPIGVDKEGNEITLIDILGSDGDSVPDIVESALEQARLLKKMKKLTKRERYVLELRYGLLSGARQTQREIAKNLGISRSYVSRIEKRAVQKLMKDLGTEGA